MPLFSIVTVTYNAEDVVELTAASLMRQTFRDFEWIVVDGASQDRTIERVIPFLDKQRDMLICEPDRGVYDAMNKGLHAAQGKIVQFLNAGDRFASEDVLATVAAAFTEGVDAVYGDTIIELPKGLSVFSPALSVKEPFRRMPFCHQALFTRRSLHVYHPFDYKTFRIAADYASFAEMHQAGATLKQLGKALAVVTVEPNSISKAGQTRAATEYHQINRRILKHPLVAETAQYLGKRASLVVGNTLRAMPFYDRLPAFVRSRVY